MTRSRQNLNGSQSAALNKLGEDFLDTLSASFERTGAEVIRRVCEENPGAFLRVIAGLVHEKPEAAVSKLDDLNPEELNRMLEALVARL